jgi:hypothetical protein
MFIRSEEPIVLFFVRLAPAVAVLMTWASCCSGQTAANTKVQLPEIVQAYIYGYAPVAMMATRDIMTAVPDSTESGQAPINQFSYKHSLATPANRLIVRPNVDTLTTTAWLDLAKEPMILHVPAVSDRYYMIPMLDAYSNEFASVGPRTTGYGAGDYAIIGPQWHGVLPGNISRVFTAPTNTVWLLGRTFVNGPHDLHKAIAVTRQYQLIPLSSYEAFVKTGKYAPPTHVPVTVPNRKFEALPVTNAAGFSKPDFFYVLARYVAENPPPEDDRAQASTLVNEGIANRNQLSPAVVSEATAAMIERAISAATHKNGWSYNLKLGNYGSDYLLRAAIAKFGFGANLPEDVVCMNARTDIDGAALSGINSYMIHFPPGRTPPQRGFWSITPYSREGFLIENSIHRYDVGSQTGLVPNADGSIDIYLQSATPHTMRNNWLPIPTAPFTLTLRIYRPRASVLDGEWAPPIVRQTNAPLP